MGRRHTLNLKSNFSFKHSNSLKRMGISSAPFATLSKQVNLLNLPKPLLTCEPPLERGVLMLREITLQRHTLLTVMEWWLKVILWLYRCSSSLPGSWFVFIQKCIRQRLCSASFSSTPKCFRSLIMQTLCYLSTIRIFTSSLYHKKSCFLISLLIFFNRIKWEYIVHILSLLPLLRSLRHTGQYQYTE